MPFSHPIYEELFDRKALHILLSILIMIFNVLPELEGRWNFVITMAMYLPGMRRKGTIIVIWMEV